MTKTESGALSGRDDMLKELGRMKDDFDAIKKASDELNYRAARADLFIGEVENQLREAGASICAEVKLPETDGASLAYMRLKGRSWGVALSDEEGVNRLLYCSREKRIRFSRSLGLLVWGVRTATEKAVQGVQ